MRPGNFLRAVGAAVDGDDDFHLIGKRGGSGLDRLQAAWEALFFIGAGIRMDNRISDYRSGMEPLPGWAPAWNVHTSHQSETRASPWFSI
jgi:hypothetical protein